MMTTNATWNIINEVTRKWIEIMKCKAWDELRKNNGKNIIKQKSIITSYDDYEDILMIYK